MFKRGTFLIGLTLTSFHVLANPSVSNIEVSQRENTKLVDISYNVSFIGGETVDISCEVSTNAGASYDVPVSSFSGDYGAGVEPGTGRLIIWNAGVDWNENYSEQMMVRITAAASRFQVLDDNGLLIADNNTGLLWNQYNTGFMSYTSALSAETVSYPFYMDAVATNYAGWRLPTLEEFQELADASTVTGLPYGHPFIISSATYWTSEIGMVMATEQITFMKGFSFYSRDGIGWVTATSWMLIDYIPVIEDNTAKLMLVKEPY